MSGSIPRRPRNQHGMLIAKVCVTLLIRMEKVIFLSANDDSMSIAERQEVIQIVTSPTGVEDAPIPPPTFQNAFHDLAENVLNWQLTGTSYHVHGLSPSAFQVPSEISSAITVSSAASTCNEERHTNGDWLSQRPSDLVNYPQLVV